EGHLNSLAVHVEMRPEFAAASETEKNQVTNALEQAIKSYIGVSAKSIVQAQGSIERSVGKAKRIVDRRK
ncbi:MAG: phenylacetate--CoA ligase, partial [Burkholderiales bacterium]